MNKLYGGIFICIITGITFFLSCTARNKQHTVLTQLPPGVYFPAWAGDTAPAAEKVELGRYLFFDRRLSFNQTKSCAGCHAPQFAFTDGYRRSFGATADMHQRNTQPLFNILFLERLTSANPSLTTPEQQMANPLFNTKFIEMGLTGHETEVLSRFRKDALYRELFAKAYPEGEDAISVLHIISAIAAFSKTIISAGSRYDEYVYHNNKHALSAAELRGRQLFFSDSLNCAACHSGFNFSGGTGPASVPFSERLYFNTGLYNTDGRGAYPAYDEGLKEFSKQPADMGKIRVPTLRNLAFTGPYMHDGSVASLPEVLDMYARGGRLIPTGENQGDGRTSPFKDARIKGFRISPQQKADLLSFLFSLTDSSLVTRPQYQNPFGEDETGR